MSQLLIERAGISRIVDLGRSGLAQQGIPEGGPWDVPAALLADALLGKVSLKQRWWIEVGPARCTMRTSVPLSVSVVGARREILFRGQRYTVCMWTGVLRPGDALTLGPSQGAMVSYVRCHAKLAEAPVYGSLSALVSAGIPSVIGRRLVDGDALHLDDVPLLRDVTAVRWVGEKGAAVLSLAPLTELRFLPGPEYDGQAVMEGTVAYQSDRQAVRIVSDRVHGCAVSQSADSAPTVTGLIQWPVQGSPMILGPDRQTLGGYPRYGVVIRCDANRLGRLVPGQSIVLRAVSRHEAWLALTAADKTLQAGERWLRSAGESVIL